MIRRIRSRAVFAELRRRGRRVRTGGVSMTHCPQPDPQPLLAFAFGRRFGTAVERNRARRRLRAAFVASWNLTAGPSGAYLLSGDRRILSAEFPQLIAATGRCLEKLSGGTQEQVRDGGDRCDR